MDLEGKPDGRGSRERPGSGWEDNIKTDCKEIRWQCVTEVVWLERGTRGGML